MTRDELFAWMRDHRAPPKGCAICGLEQLTYFRDHAERPIGFCCIAKARYTALTR